MYNRDLLEEVARASVADEHFDELMDSIGELSDDDLLEIPGVSTSLRVGI